MEFTIETAYDQSATTAMARALRKTVRKKRSRRSHTLGILVSILGIVLSLSASEITLKTVIAFLATVTIILALIWEDRINGYFARKRMLPGSEKTVVTFYGHGYHCETGAGSSDFPYENIQRIARCGHYLVFLLSSIYAQAYDMRNLTGGTREEFEAFLVEKTGKTVEII